MSNLIDLVKNIIQNDEPNNITSFYVDFEIFKDEYSYNHLLNYWKDVKDKDKTNKLYLEYKKINEFDNKSIGIFSLFYFKNKDNFLTFGKYKNDLFHLDVKCPEYKKVLDHIIDRPNELYVLTYWII